MLDISLQTLVMRLGALLILAAVCGPVPALVARILGDDGPQQDGRLTPNPFVHLDLIGAAALVVFGAGWIKPVALTPARISGGVLGAAGIAVATLLTPVALAVLAALFAPAAASVLSATASQLAGGFIAIFTGLAVGFALLNVVPVPPLAGGYLLQALWPRGAIALQRNVLIVGILVFAALASGVPDVVLQPLARQITGFLGTYS